MINIGDNLGYKGTKSNFVRDSFSTISTMAAISDTNIDDGHISYSIDTNKHYKFNRNNTVDHIMGKWRLIFSDTLGQSEDIGINQKIITNNFLTINSNIALKQDKLISGTGIQISNDNTISASVTSYTYAGTVVTTSELPQSSTVGYFYCVTNDIVPNTNYAWNGTNWQSIGNSLYQLATESKNGLMSFKDKQKLSSLQNISEDGFFLSDGDGNSILKYDSSGFDTLKISDNFKNSLKTTDGLFLQLGETNTTAYYGNKGKLNESNIEALQTNFQNLNTNNNAQHLVFNNSLSLLNSIIQQINENNGFNLVDQFGNVGLKFDESGLDAIQLSTNLKNLIKQIDGLGLMLGETNTTAYPGNLGKTNSTNIETLQTSVIKMMAQLLKINSELISTTDTGFFICDSYGNVAFKYDVYGLDFIQISTHAVSVLNDAGISGGSGFTFDIIQIL